MQTRMQTGMAMAMDMDMGMAMAMARGKRENAEELLYIDSSRIDTTIEQFNHCILIAVDIYMS